MTDESPFHIARKIRNYGDALAQQDLLAQKIDADAQFLNLPQVAAAETFSRRRNGVPHCIPRTLPRPPAALPRRRNVPRRQLLRVSIGDAFAQPVAPSPHDRRLMP